MKKYINLLSGVQLFKDISAVDLETMLACLGAEIKPVRKGEIVLLAGDAPKYVGIVLSGQLHITREDYYGNRVIITAITTSEIFAEALCCAGVMESPVTVVADTKAVVMRLHFSRILNICSNSCTFHTKLIANMLQLVASKNLLLQSRIEIVSLKSIRAKVLRYFASHSSKYGQEFTIPFNREELANYLCVERSALSHELARMKKDGLIEYSKNKFVLFGGE